MRDFTEAEAIVAAAKAVFAIVFAMAAILIVVIWEPWA